MTKTVEDAISDLTQEITAAEAAVRKKKDTVNTLCGVIGRPPAYQIDTPESVVPTAIRPDQFYGQPLATAVRIILEMRRAANLGAGSNNEIYDSLVAGGYQFNTKSEDVARASLRNSIAKNTVAFHKLPNGRFGLVGWYPNVKPARPSSSSAEDTNGVGETPPETTTSEEGREMNSSV
jgi:hypothetical protein